MNVDKTRIGATGDRDEDGSMGYHVIGEQYVFVGGNFHALVAEHLKQKEGVKTARLLRGENVISR
jgi:hypothetical protein